MAPQERRAVADLADRLDEAQGGIVAHDLDDFHDLVQRQLRVREYGPGEQAEPGPAGRAPVSRAAPVRPVVPCDLGIAGRAADLMAPFGQQALYRVRTVLLAAQPRCDRVPQLVELVGIQAVDEGAQVEGTALHALLRHLGFPPGRPPSKMSPNKEEGGLSGGFVWLGYRSMRRMVRRFIT